MVKYVSLKDAKLEMDIPEEVDRDDRLILRLIKRASRAVKEVVGRDFSKTTYTEIYDGTGTRELKLDHYPVTEVKNVWIDSESDFGSGTKEDAESYRVRGDSGILVMASEEAIWPYDPQNVKVEYTAGFDSTPEPIVDATIKTIISMYNKSKNMAYGLSSESEDDVSYSWDQSVLPREAQKIITKFKSENSL